MWKTLGKTVLGVLLASCILGPIYAIISGLPANAAQNYKDEYFDEFGYYTNYGDHQLVLEQISSIAYDPISHPTGRIVKFPVSDVLYIVMNNDIEVLLNSNGEPMTLQEFELEYVKIN